MIQYEIYSLAFAALINPHELKYESMDPKKAKKYLQPIDLTRRERANIYQSALMVICIQILTIVLICETVNLTQISNPENYKIMIPRMLSCFMMHLTCEPGIRNGLGLMKYAINHPLKFRVHYAKDPESEEKREEGMTRRVFFAFLLGFSQASIAIVVEIILIFYLSYLTGLIDIIVKFAALSFVVKFDDIYAYSLKENLITDAAGLYLQTEIKRRDFIDLKDDKKTSSEHN